MVLEYTGITLCVGLFTTCPDYSFLSLRSGQCFTQLLSLAAVCIMADIQGHISKVKITVPHIHVPSYWRNGLWQFLHTCCSWPKRLSWPWTIIISPRSMTQLIHVRVVAFIAIVGLDNVSHNCCPLSKGMAWPWPMVTMYICTCTFMSQYSSSRTLRFRRYHVTVIVYVDNYSYQYCPCTNALFCPWPNLILFSERSSLRL